MAKDHIKVTVNGKPFDYDDYEAAMEASRLADYRDASERLADAESVDRQQLAILRAYYDQCQAETTTFTVRRENGAQVADCWLPVDLAALLNRLLADNRTLVITIAEVSK